MPIVNIGPQASGGDLDEGLRQQIGQLVNHFDSIVEEVANPRNIRRAVVRSRLICNSIIVLDRSHVHVACERSHGIPTIGYYDRSSESYSTQDIADAAIWDVGFEDPFVLSIPRSLLGLPEDQQREVLLARAEEWIESESQRVEKLSQLVKIAPIFGPPDFLPDPKLCFVIMPFDEDLDPIYHQIVKPAIEEQGMVSRRADEIHGHQAIMHDVWKSICESRIVIADLTLPNPNVFYELGIAHTVGKPTILLSQKGRSEFPFDVAHLRGIIYENTAAGGQQLRQELSETIRLIRPTVISPNRTDQWI